MTLHPIWLASIIYNSTGQQLLPMKLHNCSVSDTAPLRDTTPLRYPVGVQIGPHLPRPLCDIFEMSGKSFSSVDVGIANFHASQRIDAETPPLLLDYQTGQLAP